MAKITTSNQTIFRILVVAFGVLFIFFIYSLASRENINVAPEGTDIDYSKQANIFEGEDLLNQLGSLDSFNNLSRDLYSYASVAYESYILDNKLTVGFKIISKINTENNKIRFEGNYGSGSNKIEVEVEKLNNKRMKVSIIDTKTKLNINNSLPSNSARNQFIGQLPIENNNYVIEYLDNSDDFLITLYNNSFLTEAETTLNNGLGGNLQYSIYKVLIPTSSDEGFGTPAE